MVLYAVDSRVIFTGGTSSKKAQRGTQFQILSMVCLGFTLSKHISKYKVNTFKYKIYYEFKSQITKIEILLIVSDPSS